jgi:hypothetical protein
LRKYCKLFIVVWIDDAIQFEYHATKESLMHILPALAVLLVGCLTFWHLKQNWKIYVPTFRSVVTMNYVGKICLLCIVPFRSPDELLVWGVVIAAMFVLCDMLMSACTRRSWGHVWEFPRTPLTCPTESYFKRLAYHVYHDCAALFFVFGLYVCSTVGQHAAQAE